MDILLNLGYIAGLCTTIAFVPQVFRTWKTQHAQDISYGMLLLLITGVALWLIYGGVINDKPVILANGITLVLLFILTVMKIHFSRKEI